MRQRASGLFTRARPAARVRSSIAPAALLACVALSGCGGSSGATLTAPAVAPARIFTLAGFQPGAAVLPGHATTVSFTVQMPDGKPLTTYKTGTGPHTGVHLIIVRDDLAYIIHQHPPIGPGGLLRQTVTFPAPGTYRVLVDAYPNIPGGQPNFQLFQTVHVVGRSHAISLPPFRASQVVAGYHVTMQGHLHLHAIQAAFVNVDVLDPRGHPVSFVPWFGALAHAIFFHQGSLDYFHTHICAPNAPNCGTLPGVAASRVTGQATAPGKLTVGILLPVPGTWRLFLQMKLNGRIITAPFTLEVAS